MRWSYVALVVLAVLAVQSFAASVAVTNTKLQTKYGSLTNVYFETASGPGSSTPGTNTALAPPGTSGSYSIPQGTSGYLWSPQFASATTISAGNWVFDFWAAAAAYTYVPITLTNNQGSATSNPFQVMVQPNPSLYPTYEASDLGNIEFCTNTICTTKLYSWLEGCGTSAPYGPCSTASTSATFWVKLVSSVGGGGGSLTIYMVFLPASTEFDGIYRGESPQLSTTYAAYDNGANVFDLYFNGNTAVASFNAGSHNTVAQATAANPISGGPTINVVGLTGYGAANRVNMILTTPLPSANPSYGEIAESYSEIQTGYAANLQGLAGFCDSSSASSATINAESEVVGASGTLYAYVYVANGVATKTAGTGADAALTWYYAGLAYPGTTSTSFSGIVSTTFYAAYAASTPNHPITGSTQLYWCSVGASVAGNPDGIYFNWGRSRAYPPGGVPPTISYGSISPNTVGVSIYITGSTGTVLTTVASNVQSPVLGTAEAQYELTFAVAQVNIPQNGFVSVVITASSSVSVYWGVGQLTDFQVPYRVLT